jgi:hypothetical protein
MAEGPNLLYYGDNLDVFAEHVESESAHRLDASTSCWDLREAEAPAFGSPPGPSYAKAFVMKTLLGSSL